MNAIRLKNFRCFGDVQQVTLAPLTLLVGENSTGKTSFMAAIRALWSMFYSQRVPDFKEQPYDLGVFADIVHSPQQDGAPYARRFELGMTYSARSDSSVPRPCQFDVSFDKNGAAPDPVQFRLSDVQHNIWVEYSRQQSDLWQVSVGTPQGLWKPSPKGKPPVIHGDQIWPFFIGMQVYTRNDMTSVRLGDGFPLLGETSHRSTKIAPDTWRAVEDLCRSQFAHPFFDNVMYASAPVRSKPRRTYDPSRVVHDPEGDDTPSYLGNLALQREGKWKALKQDLANFGVDSGLFNELEVRSFGNRTASDPFQLQIKEAGSQADSPFRNLVDVGYGVSQVLPVVTELLRFRAPPAFLLQQPEVHLHPSAQAALGSLFCRVARPGKLLVVETHSDHLMDRVRMDVRDGRTNLRPQDVAVLFFERVNRDVRIHQLKIDKEGNVLGTPTSYRQFFMQEVQRSLNL